VLSLLHEVGHLRNRNINDLAPTCKLDYVLFTSLSGLDCQNPALRPDRFSSGKLLCGQKVNAALNPN